MSAVLQATPPPHCPLPAVRDEARSVWSAQALRGAAPLWSTRESALYWVDAPSQQLHRFQPAQRLRDSWSLDQPVSALAERAGHAGLLLALRHELAFFDPDTARLELLHRPEPAQPGNRLRAGLCDSQGRFWCSTAPGTGQSPTGALYRYAGGSRCVRQLENLGDSPGMTWTRDQQTLLVADPTQNRIWAHALETNGQLGPARSWLALPRHEGTPQGLCTDAAGRIWLARAGTGRASCHHPETGAELLHIQLPASQLTGCAFGGPQLRTLFITSGSTHASAALFSEPLAGALFAVEVDSPGLPAHLFAG
ncbi:SMP-30/gluconolactonase/LRE family protein [uncultured Rhodoferax sp.]|uniref:SMP-30/gluconolactonase/LRE family protein n=1 Tax=uncultured Rhodoferax sp. TaxID=223188 RepID=UPI0025F65C88|nr:SMP-30/gluconolactonase/LRE family protein [uncultured Rhodoferax sp.]